MLQLPFRTQKSIVRLLKVILIPIGLAAFSNERSAHAVWVACLVLHVLKCFVSLPRLLHENGGRQAINNSERATGLLNTIQSVSQDCE